MRGLRGWAMLVRRGILLSNVPLRSRVFAIGRAERGTPTPALLSPPKRLEPQRLIPRAVPAPCRCQNSLEASL
jgi:hypothetical protein